MDDSKLTKNGKLFLLHARNAHGTKLINVNADIEDDLTFPIVYVKSKIARSERMRRFGADGLTKSDFSGKISKKGCPIPTDSYIERVTTMYGDDFDGYHVSIEPYCNGLKKGQITLEDAINMAGDHLLESITEGEYEIPGAIPCPFCNSLLPVKSLSATISGSVRSEKKAIASKENAKKPRPNAKGKPKPRKKNY